jgi:hypothetical protein
MSCWVLAADWQRPRDVRSTPISDQAAAPHEDKKWVPANITTIEFLPDGQRTQVRVTVQMASFVGEGMIDNTKAGHTASLSSMAQYLEQPAS